MAKTILVKDKTTGKTAMVGLSKYVPPTKFNGLKLARATTAKNALASKMA